MLELPEVNRFLSGMLSGVDIRYPLSGAHPLVGRRYFGVTLRPDRGALLDCGGTAERAELVSGWSDRVEYRPPDALPENARLVLVRPDGYVCWASADPMDHSGLVAALNRWFGAELPFAQSANGHAAAYLIAD